MTWDTAASMRKCTRRCKCGEKHRVISSHNLSYMRRQAILMEHLYNGGSKRVKSLIFALN